MNPRLQKLCLVLSDLVAQILAFALGALALAVYGRYSSLENLNGWWATTGEIHSLVHFVFVLLVLVRFYVKGLYSRRLPFWDELRLILATLAYLALLHGMVVLIAKWPFSRVLWFSSWAAAAILIPFLRHRTRRILHKAGAWSRPTLIIGTGDTAVSTYKALLSEPQLGYHIIEFLGFEGQAQSPSLPVNLPCRKIAKEDLIQELFRIEERYPHVQVLIALEQIDSQAAGELLERLSLYLEDLHLVPPIGGLPLFGLEANHFFSHEILLLRSKNNLGFRPQYLLKRVFDLVAASLLLVLLSPLLAFIALQIRRSGPGVLFVQPRWGRKGEKFYCYKFRTMVPDAEKILKDLLDRDPVARKEWEEKTKITNDPRITPIGEFLRKTSLDELPQLLNVIKGDMSLVGPRPILLHENEKYGARLSFYHNVRPGITGLWQVSGRSDTDYANRIRLDTWYVKNWSLWYDIAILFKTIKVVMKRKGAY
jgi:Undecaprenyl-phosphate galactose phosphotransferase WbaP